MKIRIALISVAAAVVLAACGSDESSTAAADSEPADATSTASIVNTAQAFQAATSAEGTWIIAITEDVSVNEEIVVTGEFTNRDEPARKIALYAQDADRNITDRYTLTAPRMVVESPVARIQGGTFVGDVYVDANGFQIVDATVDGDVVFSSAEYRESAEVDDGSVTGQISVE